MSRADGILHLVLNVRPWEEIKAGRKPVEYREMRWFDRIFPDGSLDPTYHTVRLQRGFRMVDGIVPTITFRIDRIDFGEADPRWTYDVVPRCEEFIRIWLGERIA